MHRENAIIMLVRISATTFDSTFIVLQSLIKCSTFNCNSFLMWEANEEKCTLIRAKFLSNGG